MAKKQNVIGGKAAAEQAAAMQERKKRFAIIGGTIGGLLVIAAIALLFFFLQPKNDTFGAAEEIYANNKISYSRDDYNKDKNAIDNNSDDVSDAYTKMKKKNNKVINNILKHYGEDPSDPDSPTPVTPGGEDVDMDAWCNALIAQLTESNNYISNHYGLENENFISKDETGKEFDARPMAYEDISNVEKYLAGGSQPTLRFYKYWDINEFGNALRISAYEKTKFSIRLIDNNNKIYTKWFAAKHPVFSKIYTVELTEATDVIDSSHVSSIRGNIVTDNGNYTVYSTLVVNNDRTFSFKFFDVSE